MSRYEPPGGSVDNDVRIWSTAPDMQLRDEQIGDRGGWPSDPRPLHLRVAEMLAENLLLAIGVAVAMLAATRLI